MGGLQSIQHSTDIYEEPHTIPATGEEQRTRQKPLLSQIFHFGGDWFFKKDKEVKHVLFICILHDTKVQWRKVR